MGRPGAEPNHRLRREDERSRREPAVGDERRAAASPGERLAARLGNSGLRALARLEIGSGITTGGVVRPDIHALITARRGAGAPLDPDLRDRFAPTLGDPLANVRVHTDATADHLARAVAARAFVTGRDVFFGAGEYRPGTSEGNQVIAHELTHVVQQRGAGESGPMKVSDPDDPLEREADAVARELDG